MTGSDFDALLRKTGMNRRSMLRLMGMGVAGAAAVPLLSSCTGTSNGGNTSATSTSTASAAGSATGGSAAGGGQVGGSVSFGSNLSDEVPKKAYEAVFAKFTEQSGTTVNVNTVDHNSFQENINNYLQGSPDELFTWFAGNRMQFFAEQGLLTPIDDVWAGFEDQYSEGFINASTAADGNKYFVPFYNYPWAFFYRKSLFEEKGYEVPTTLDELKTLGATMQADGLAPIAFGDKDGWPAMGTFDYLNMRTNGYQFHMDLMAHKEAWTDPKVKTVFDTWKGLLPLHQSDPLGRTWQEAAQSMVKKEAGMYLLGMFVGQQMPTEEYDDLDFFAFPEIDSTIGADAVEAPIDGFLASSKGLTDQSRALLTYLASPEAQLQYLGGDPSNVAANKTADTSGYSPLQKKAVELISSAKNISQFLDRDTRPDFASPVVIPALQQFLKDGDVDSVTNSLEDQAKTIFV
ncbi:ABC transporter substrate-binding protein [Nakamurella deserti]|uniref:ABC transporter substrate-binding protein n=1 Tax=Nakamurella deserti TaxID=2164074 RepID=UPI000DBE0873|nr:ABC transporter substrate-binding protein [Nakamurella deserti]